MCSICFLFRLSEAVDKRKHSARKSWTRTCACYIYGPNDIQPAFSSKSLKVAWMHGRLTQQDSVRADPRGRYAICSDTNDSCVRARKSAREKRSLDSRDFPRDRSPGTDSSIRRSRNAMHLRRPAYRGNLSRGSNLPPADPHAYTANPRVEGLNARAKRVMPPPPLFNPLLAACFLSTDESDIYSLSIEC